MADKTEDQVRHTIPFTKEEYYSSNEVERKRLLMTLIRAVAKGAPEFDLSEFQKRFESNPLVVITCQHELMLFGMVAKLESMVKEISTLNERMEDLCLEMERIESESERMFVCGAEVKMTRKQG